MNSRRFDYVQYDVDAIAKSERIKSLFVQLENIIDQCLPDSRPKSLCMTELEKAFMWVGKGLRDEVIKKTPGVLHKVERG